MKRLLIVLAPLAALAVSAGCDETLFGGAYSTNVSGSDLNAKIAAVTSPIQLRDRDQLRLHLMDGTGDGHQYQFGGSQTPGGGGNGGGDGDRDRDRLRDGSCGDGG